MFTLLIAAIDHVDPEQIRRALIFLCALILSTAVHEYGHARMADHLGDRLPRSQGRVTLNPLVHIDVWGTVVFPLLMILTSFGGVLGWGRPVQVSLGIHRYRHGLSPRAAHFLIAAAGPMMNVALALATSFLLVGALHWEMRGTALVLADLVMLNVGLAAFNLLPCPPLDGGTLLVSLLGPGHPVSRLLQRYGAVTFVILLVTGALTLVLSPVGALAKLWLTTLISWVH